jgi:hypothetical protein
MDRRYSLNNETLSMQRTATIMESGELCDFRVYLG